ncbi:tripartite tricarboxylate transporter TctB family protein [Zobellella taiwanensis]
MKNLNANRLIGLVMALVSLGYLWMAYRIPTFPMPRPIDSDAFPKLLGLALLVLSVLLCLDKPPALRAKTTSNPPRQKSRGLSPTAQLLTTFVVIALYAISLEWLGFVLASGLFGMGLSYCYGYRRHLISAVATLSVVLSLYLIMTRLLEVHLPQGLLPF